MRAATPARSPTARLGVCKVRFNRGGVLHVPFGYVGGVQCDPIEKKPFFHARPGALAFSFGMLGCDLHCSYCQNWVTSQALRDPEAVAPPQDVAPAALVAEARPPRRARRGQHLQRAAHHQRVGGRRLPARRAPRGLMTAFVSNGNGTPRVLDYIRPWVDLYKVDLKSFDDRHYRQLGGRIEPILETIRALHEMGIWLEIVTLLIPGFNDSPDEIDRLTTLRRRRLARHPVARHGVPQGLPDDRSRRTRRRRCWCAPPRSGAGTACATSTPGTCPDGRRSREHALPRCRALLVERYGYHVHAVPADAGGRLSGCGTPIPGRWGAAFEGQISAVAVPARLGAARRG